jgi:chlorite dismutase
MSDEIRAPEEEQPLRIDVAERAGDHSGYPQTLESRLFMQLLVFECEQTQEPTVVLDGLERALLRRSVTAVLYEEVNAPRHVAVLTFSEDPSYFVRAVRPALNVMTPQLRQVTAMSMLGRTYSTGYEPDLRHALLERPAQTALNPDWPWAIWYPLRRRGEFNRLERSEKAAILKEHSLIGRAYGEQDLAHDIRLACHGLDASDNEFIIGLIGRELHPLSHIVESMRRTRQTSEFIAQMGPFFVGHVARRVVPR